MVDGKENGMRKIIAAEFMTLDGVIQAPGATDEDPDGGFAHGGGTRPYWHNDIGVHFFEAFSLADALLLGHSVIVAIAGTVVFGWVTATSVRLKTEAGA
jgi:hypothetical protein